MDRKRSLPTGMDVISLRLTSDLHAEVRELASKAERTVSQEVRAAIKAHVERATEEEAA